MNHAETRTIMTVWIPNSRHIDLFPKAERSANEKAMKYARAPNAAIGMPNSSEYELDSTCSQPLVTLHGTGSAV